MTIITIGDKHKLIYLDQIFDKDKTRYVRVKDLIEFVKRGIENTKRSRKPHAKYFRQAWEQMLNKMEELEHGHNDDIAIKIPKRFLSENNQNNLDITQSVQYNVSQTIGE